MTYMFEGKQFIVVAVGGVEQAADVRGAQREAAAWTTTSVFDWYGVSAFREPPSRPMPGIVWRPTESRQSGGSSVSVYLSSSSSCRWRRVRKWSRTKSATSRPSR